MRILAIRGARLASLDAPFEVDLSAEPLRSAGVFAVVGPTGAGKSSLLDALCLALFDTTPRLERTPRQRLPSGDRSLDEDTELTASDPRTLVRRGARDAFAEVDFAGIDGRSYRARWAVARGRNGRLRPTQLSLADLGSERVIGGTKGEVLAAIESRLGLGLAELRRAVLLPQGEVAAFLDAPSDERAILLERLTGAEIFAEVSRVVHRRAADARRARENAEVLRAMVPVLDAEAVLRHEAELFDARLGVVRAEERAAALLAERDRHAVLARLAAEEREAADALAEVERQRGLVELLRDEVARVEQLAPHEVSFDDERRARGRVGEAQGRLETERRAHASAVEVLVPLERELASADSVHAARVVADEAERDEARVALAALEQAVAAARPACSDAELEALRARARALLGLAGAVERARASEVAEQRSAAELERARETRAGLRARMAALDARAYELAVDATAQSARLEEARRARERWLLGQTLAVHRARLVEGEPCPLCGATEHPARGGANDVALAESEERVATIALALERTRETLSRVRSALAALTHEASATEARADAAQSEIERARSDRALAQAALALVEGPEAEREVSITRMLADVDGRIAAAEDARRRHRTADEALAAARAKAHAAREAAHHETAALAARCATAARAFERARERASALAESVERAESALAEREAELRAAVAETDGVLTSLGVARADAERVLGPEREKLRRARADLERLDRERASARARLDERRARASLERAALGEQPGLAGEALDAAITDARRARDEARRREARLEALLELDRSNRVRAAELDAVCETACAEEARWEGLDACIGSADGKRFRAYAQAITLERLVGFANAELSHLAPRFSLVRARTGGELGLAVLDRDAGHAIRAVQSLSGGESFLVSLALALGLASMTAAEGGRGTLRSSSLFLDEGLGALDPESLEIALGALEALRASGRQIAIVTHVPQVAERFAARVEVVPRGAGRSDVRVIHG